MTRTRKSAAIKAAALQVGSRLPQASLHPSVLAWAERDKGRGPWCVALSGGADSVALLLVLWTHWPQRRDRLVVLHFDHRLRGATSAADARFCADLCRNLEVKCVRGGWTRAPRAASEAESRAARHAFFDREMKHWKSRVLWLAHQRDDIAESMLMRLARGSGAAGLAAPRPVQPASGGLVRLRPFLTIPKADLAAALRHAGVGWREDRSNARPDHFRNRLRSRVIPAWLAAAGRDAAAGAALSRERIEEDDLALEAWVDTAGLLENPNVLDVGGCQALPRAVVRRALHRWLLAVGPDTDLSRQGFDLLLTAVERGTATRFSVGSGFAEVKRGQLRFVSR